MGEGWGKRGWVHCLIIPVPKLFCLGPLLLVLRFFHTVGLVAVDYEMVDSAVRKKPSKARGAYKVYSDKDHFSIRKKCNVPRLQ